jgi:hypothetical protein
MKSGCGRSRWGVVGPGTWVGGAVKYWILDETV